MLFSSYFENSISRLLFKVLKLKIKTRKAILTVLSLKMNFSCKTLFLRVSIIELEQDTRLARLKKNHPVLDLCQTNNMICLFDQFAK